MQDQNELDWKPLMLFAHYTCKQKTEIQTLRIANYISRESTESTLNQLMGKDEFTETISFILTMASTGLMKAVVQIGYMEDCYQISDYQNLEASIQSLS